MATASDRRLILALPFTILHETGMVRLIAGENMRFTLRGSGLELWLPTLLARCKTACTVAGLLNEVDAEVQLFAVQVIEQLISERVLVDAPVEQSHTPAIAGLEVHGSGPLVARLRSIPTSENADQVVTALCQDALDYHSAARWNREQLSQRRLWISTGAMSRAYVSPLFLPGAGPCLSCLFRAFEALSPAPELYDALRVHAQENREIPAVPFPSVGVEILAGLVQWKLQQAAEPWPASGLYRLHVLEVRSMEISTHTVLRSVDCPDCSSFVERS